MNTTTYDDAADVHGEAQRKRHLSLPKVPSRKVWRGLLGILALLVLWQALPEIGVLDPLFVPPLSKVLAALWQMASNGQLWLHTSSSLSRVLPGLALALLLGIPAGLFVGTSKALRETIGPVLEILRNTSALALLPVFTLLLGIGQSSKVAMVFYAAVWPIFLGTINGVQGVDPLWLKAGRSMGLSRQGLFLRVILPASLPSIFTGVRLASAAALLVLVAAEMVGARAGLGYLVNAAQLDFDIPQMYAAIFVLSVIGGGVNFLLQRVESSLTRWKSA
ncbi:nitrate/sulfonate/bicarbonate ABC transporter permease [Neokomagataea thailandica NBRC 106555]|uniref:ABC transporter permease n=2 Tax=Neokomagataea TaxID=1223423 RepID=A0A4Y6V9P0_9PROT|nr:MULTISPECIES: ABC transporter permease [Neokomagataea]QDH25206.1 ABC transporter permease [Neokomagataea tanensis]GBR53442.1 nitrate/sulfonate/bicarbonate ABC transporter permease [Neokomagataea thailandica NBRC 106555]